MTLLAGHEGKRALERAWLLYTPIWGAITGLIMLTGAAERWGDVELLAFGIVLAVGTYVAGWVSMPASERALPFVQRTAVKQSLAVTVLSFGLNYFQTPFFFDVLHMRYGFRAEWAIERNPVFLYLVTVAYFATYSVLACIAVRATLARFPWMTRAVAILAAACALAFLETALNANPWMTRLFCYGEPAQMLTFGTLVYGVALALAIPGWLAVDEAPAARSTLAVALGAAVLAVIVDTAVVVALRATVAPLVTTVEDSSSPGWDAGGCLGRGAD